jgi:hypothetical protein
MIMLYTDRNCIRGSVTGSFPILARIAKDAEFRQWAIYWENLIYGNFHNATDERYLVAHNDDYWINRGFSPTELKI